MRHDDRRNLGTRLSAVSDTGTGATPANRNVRSIAGSATSIIARLPPYTRYVEPSPLGRRTKMAPSFGDGTTSDAGMPTVVVPSGFSQTAHRRSRNPTAARADGAHRRCRRRATADGSETVVIDHPRDRGSSQDQAGRRQIGRRVGAADSKTNSAPDCRDITRARPPALRPA